MSKAVDLRSDIHRNGCGDAADSGIPGVFGRLLLFLKRAAKNQVHGSLRVGGGMNDEAVIFFQLFDPVLDVCGGIAVGVLVSNASESKDAANFTCGENGAPLAPPRLELNICPLGRSVEYNRE